jgi:hypothetical protein
MRPLRPGVIRRIYMKRIIIDEENDIIEIDGFKFDGIELDAKCEKCKATLFLQYQYDRSFCPECNVWKEKHPVCSDPGCPYCSIEHPKKPLPELNMTEKRITSQSR